MLLSAADNVGKTLLLLVKLWIFCDRYLICTKISDYFPLVTQIEESLNEWPDLISK